jgi:Na+-translocating ferredoxin:NAD+ oxidoreductase RnfD subunit
MTGLAMLKNPGMNSGHSKQGCVFVLACTTVFLFFLIKKYNAYAEEVAHYVLLYNLKCNIE